MKGSKSVVSELVPNVLPKYTLGAEAIRACANRFAWKILKYKLEGGNSDVNVPTLNRENVV